jgi:PAS domain S-box-containing protein
MNIDQSKFLLSQEVTDKILLSMQEGLFILNSDDQIQNINQSGLRIFKFDSEKEIIGKHLNTIFAKPKEAFEFLIFLEKEKHLNYHELLLKKSNGQQMLCSLSASIIQDTVEGDILKVIILQDITERRKNEQQLENYSARLEKSNQELDQFAYIVSHDLKAPLRAIINLSQWLHEDAGESLSEDSKKNLEMLKGRAFRMEALITGILEYSKIGRAEVQLELIEVDALLNEILYLLLPPKHVKVKIAPDMPVLNAPKIMLLQIFSNLISNAIKYNDKAECIINIDVKEKDDFFEFSVQDNGPGIPKDYHEKIFVIFQTLQSRDKVESTGIGLTIVKKIVEDQGGRIWIESVEGEGTKFTFQWPKKNSARL